MTRRRTRRPRIQLVPANCERCGREVYTANRSLFGLDHLKAKWGVLCNVCTTEAEQREMLDDQFQGIMGVRPPRSEV